MLGRRAVAVVGVMAVVVAGCSASSKSELGAGEDVDVCAGYRIYEALPDPSPDEPEAVREYAAGAMRVLERIRTDFDIRTARGETAPVPEAVVQDLQAVEERLRAFQEEVEAAEDDKARVRRAMSEFTADRSYQGADSRLGQFYVTTCPH